MIIQENRLKEKYPNTFVRDLSVITEIIYHCTAGFSTYKGFIEWVLSGERDEEYKDNIGFFHFVIDREGGIHQVFNYENWFYHSSSGRHDQKTIGIELINPSATNEDELTGAQYDALIDLTFNELFKRFHINCIAGHSVTGLVYSGHYKETPPCPGSKFRWDIIKNELIGRKFNFTTALERLTDIGIQ